MEKHILNDIQLYEEEGQFYLKLKYIVEDNHRVQEIEIPKVEIPINRGTHPRLNYKGITRSSWPLEECTLNAGFGHELNLRSGKTSEANHVFYTVKTIKEKHTEMTISEIEKKLGYKIKIVAEDTK